MKKIFRSLILTSVFLLCICSSAFCSGSSSTTPEAYRPGEFPQWALDLRRTEIITLGSLPVATIGVSLAYGGYLYYTGELDSFPNPLDKSTTSFTSDQQMKVFFMSLGVSATLGLVDLAITLIRRNARHHRQQKILQEQSHASVVPVFPGEMHPDERPPENEPDAAGVFESEEVLEIESDTDFVPSVTSDAGDSE